MRVRKAYESLSTGAISEYQDKLLVGVKEDIHKLQQTFKAGYLGSPAWTMSSVRDFQPISGAIIWARQIERQLQTYMKRVREVLGEEWASYAEGSKLKAESDAFGKKLDTKPIFDAWHHDMTRKNLKVDGFLFKISQVRSAQGGLELGVNWDRHIIPLFKEVRNFRALGYPIGNPLSGAASEGKRLYPHAVGLMETVSAYQQTLHKIAKNPGIKPLVAQAHKEVQSHLDQCESISRRFLVGAR